MPQGSSQWNTYHGQSTYHCKFWQIDPLFWPWGKNYVVCHMHVTVQCGVLQQGIWYWKQCMPTWWYFVPLSRVCVHLQYFYDSPESSLSLSFPPSFLPLSLPPFILGFSLPSFSPSSPLSSHLQRLELLQVYAGNSAMVFTLCAANGVVSHFIWLLRTFTSCCIVHPATIQFIAVTLWHHLLADLHWIEGWYGASHCTWLNCILPL